MALFDPNDPAVCNSSHYKNFKDVAARITGIVWYLGSSDNLSMLFIFRNAKKFLYQDYQDFKEKIERNLKRLKEEGYLLGNIEVKAVGEGRMRYDFLFSPSKSGFQPKEIITYYGKNWNLNKRQPEEIHEVDAITSHAIPASSLNVPEILPKLRVGCRIMHSYDYVLEYVNPESFGLEKDGHALIKVQQIDTRTIKKRKETVLAKKRNDAEKYFNSKREAVKEAIVQEIIKEFKPSSAQIKLAKEEKQISFGLHIANKIHELLTAETTAWDFFNMVYFWEEKRIGFLDEILDECCNRFGIPNPYSLMETLN